MRPTVLGLGLLCVLVAVPIRCEDVPPPPEPVGASIREESDHTLYEAILPGELVDWGVVPMSSFPRLLAVLIELEDGSRQVIRWSPAAGDDLEEVGPPLPEEVDSLVPYRGEGANDGAILVASEGTLLGLGAGGQWKKLFESPFDLFTIRDTRQGRFTSRGDLILRSVGLLQAVRREATGDPLRVIWEFELPLRVDREWGGLRLETPPIAVAHWTPEGNPQLVLGPETHGKRRIRSVLLSPSAEGELETLETWNMLSTAEDIEESWYVVYNGEPALIVTTVLAEKHGVFEKKKLRLFRLTDDRTRSGSGPILEAMTRSRNWYGTCAGIADVNGDGLDDLVSAQPKGLGAGSLWVEAYLARPGGGFEPKARGSELEVEEGEICTLTTDIDGDGRVELIVVEDETLLVFPLVQRQDSKTVVDEQPRWRLSFESIDGRPRPVDLVESGSTQMLLTGHTEGKRQVMRVIQFH